MRAADDGAEAAAMTPAERLVRTELARTQQEARVTFRRGVALIAAIPLVLAAAIAAANLFGAVAALLAFVAVAIYMLVGGIAGISMMVVGVAEHRRSARQLEELDATRRLPEARVVIR